MGAELPGGQRAIVELDSLTWPAKIFKGGNHLTYPAILFQI